MSLAAVVFAAILPTLATQVMKETSPPVYRPPLFRPPDLSLNQTASRWGVTGADLGILWDGGRGMVYSIYGDSFYNNTDHRSNVLAYSIDRVFTDGMALSVAVTDAPNHASVAIPTSYTDGTGNIPSAGISVGDTQYVHFMSVKFHGTDGGAGYATNYSGIASMDGYFNPFTESSVTWSPTSNFGMGALYHEGNYVYLFGTKPGRVSGVRLARVLDNQILTKSAWQYLTPSGWSSSETTAMDIVTGPVGEMSVQYNTYFHRYIMTYYDPFTQGRRDAVMLRDSPSLAGPWTGAKIIAAGDTYGGPWHLPYGSYIHPWSNDGTDLYFVMSLFSPIYNTFLMHSTLSNNGDENMLSDPGFEDQTSNPGYGVLAPWVPSATGGATIQRGTGTAHTGANHARLAATDHAQHTIGQMVAVKPFTTYHATAWVHTSPGMQNGSLSIRDNPGYPATLIAATLIDSTAAASPPGAPVSLTFSSGGHTHVAFVVGFAGDGTSNELLLDDASLIQQ